MFTLEQNKEVHRGNEATTEKECIKARAAAVESSISRPVRIAPATVGRRGAMREPVKISIRV